jgi:hypothetical protein
MDGNGVSVRVGKHESPPKWTIERFGHDSNAGLNKAIVQGLRVIGFEPQCDAPAQMLDSLQVNGGHTNGKGYWSGGKDDRSWWALGRPLKAKLLRIERSRYLDVSDLQ